MNPDIFAKMLQGDCHIAKQDESRFQKTIHSAIMLFILDHPHGTDEKVKMELTKALDTVIANIRVYESDHPSLPILEAEKDEVLKAFED